MGPEQRFYDKNAYEYFEHISYSFLTSALEQGSNEALYLLGYAHLEGRGVDAHPQKSLDYFRTFEICTGNSVSNELNLLTLHHNIDTDMASNLSVSQTLSDTYCQSNQRVN